MTVDNILFAVAGTSFFFCFIWSLVVVKKGRGFFIESENNASRLDYKLLRELIIESLTAGGFTLLLSNFFYFLVTCEWILEPTFDQLSLLVVFIFSILYIIEHIYDFTKDKAEKPKLVTKNHNN